jgi:hypothetical protein
MEAEARDENKNRSVTTVLYSLGRFIGGKDNWPINGQAA